MIYRSIIYLCFGLTLVILLEAEIPEDSPASPVGISSHEYDELKSIVLEKQRKLQEDGGLSLNSNSMTAGKAIVVYNQNPENQEALEVLKSALQTEGKSGEKSVILRRVKIDKQIYPLIQKLSEDDPEERIRKFASSLIDKVEAAGGIEEYSKEMGASTSDHSEKSLVQVSNLTHATETVSLAQALDPIIKEPTKVALVELAEESPNGSPNWLLWLIGALVVVGGLVVVVRRKN